VRVAAVAHVVEGTHHDEVVVDARLPVEREADSSVAEGMVRELDPARELLGRDTGGTAKVVVTDDHGLHRNVEHGRQCHLCAKRENTEDVEHGSRIRDHVCTSSPGTLASAMIRKPCLS
jgi:hypothetical protein